MTFPIPSNDDASKSIDIILSQVADAIKEALNDREKESETKTKKKFPKKIKIKIKDITMTKITASEVNKLRKQTGAGMMDCKKALVEAGGDFDEAAIDILRKKGQKVAAKELIEKLLRVL